MLKIYPVDAAVELSCEMQSQWQMQGAVEYEIYVAPLTFHRIKNRKKETTKSLEPFFIRHR